MAAYPAFVYVVSRATTTILIRKVHILTRDFSLELYVLPDDDKRYASQSTCLPARETTYTNAGYATTTILIRKVHILTRDFS